MELLIGALNNLMLKESSEINFGNIIDRTLQGVRAIIIGKSVHCKKHKWSEGQVRGLYEDVCCARS